jgi:rubredoxin
MGDEGKARADAAAAEPATRPAPPARMPCPACGSPRTQPFTHAGPAARVNMRCLKCGHQFRDTALRR